MPALHATASARAPIAPPPPLPPKDAHTELDLTDDAIPTTLRLGTNLLGLALPMPSDGLAVPASAASAASAASTSAMSNGGHSPAHTSKSSQLVSLKTTPPRPLPAPAPFTHPGLSRGSSMAAQYSESAESLSSASISVSERSVSTITPGPASPATPTGPRSILNLRDKTDMGIITPSIEWAQKGREGSRCLPRPTLGTSVSSTSGESVPLARKKTSAQLLSGIGRGIGRMGTVMRRHMSDGDVPMSAAKVESLRIRSWQRKGKSSAESIQEEGDGWRRSGSGEARRDPVPGDEGDAGIGRPFNVEHDLHVSPSLEDLPEPWLEALRAQGLSDQDLLVIASARKKQATVLTHPLRPIKGSEPPGSVGPNKPPSYLLTSTDGNGRVRGRSTPNTSSSSHPHDVGSNVFSSITSTTAAKGASLFSLAHLTPTGPTLPHKKLPLDSFPSDEPSKDEKIDSTRFVESPVASPSSVAEARDVPGELMALGGGRVRTPRKNKRLSDQLRCFSRFDLGGDEQWGADLIRAISGSGLGDPAGTPTQSSTATEMSPPTTSFTAVEPDSPKNPPPRLPEKEPCGSTTKLSEQGKSIKRIPIPPLLPPTALKAPFDVPDLDLTSLKGLASTSPPLDLALKTVRSQPTPTSVASTLGPASDYAVSPDRRSPDSFGAYLSQSKSSLNLITPSSSGLHDRHSPPSSDEGGGEAESECSYLDFGMALREAGELTPRSLFSEKLRAYLPTPEKTATFNGGDEEISRGRFATSGQIHPDPAFSVPTSIHSSLPSRASTPDSGLLVPPNTATHMPVTPTLTSPTSPRKKSQREERASVALSTLSSDSSQLHQSLHEATVQTAYATMLREGWAKTEGQKRGRRVGAIVEESEAGDSESEAGRSGSEVECGESEEGWSAIEALEEAARRIAGAKRLSRRHLGAVD